MILLMLIATPLTFVQERFIPNAIGSMVLCTGDGHEVVIMGADGKPIKRSESCVDCITNFVSLDTEYQDEIKIPFVLFSDFVFAHKDISQINLRYDWPLSRGPPAVVQA